MTNEQAKSELMQIYGSLSEEKKMALDVLMAQADVTDDDIATMRILFNADIECLCNQGRFNDAKEMEQIRDRLKARLQADGEKTCGTCRNEDTYHCAECENKSDYEQAQTEKVIKMRDATPEERESVDKYIKSISKPTGVDFDSLSDSQTIHHLTDEAYSELCLLAAKGREMLQPQADGDLISRQAVLNNLCNSCTNIGCEFQSGIVRTECAFYMPPHIESDNCGNYVVIPPVKLQEPKWISTNERLPDEVGTYMTTVDYEKHGVAVGQRYYHGKGLGWEDDCVIAWMPLPKPYEPQERSEE